MTPEPLILAVETSSRTGSVAVALGEKLLAETSFSGPTRHSAEIFPAIQHLIKRFVRKPHEIEQVHISIGPGSFTGLRIATTLAKTMHLANGARIVAVDTLDVVAANLIYPAPKKSREPEVTSHERIAAILDAKRNQFFVAVYDRTSNQRLTAESAESAEEIEIENLSVLCELGGKRWKKSFADSLMTAAQFIEKFARSDKPVWLLGDGLLYHRDKFQTEGICFLDQKYWSPRASIVHLLGWQKAVAGEFSDPLTLQPAYLRKPDVTIKKINPQRGLAD